MIQVDPIINLKVRGMCKRPYPGHPKGCPNWNQRPDCPPHAPPLKDILDLSQPVYLVYNAFELAAHVKRMKKTHPEWSKRQLRCCLYWQGTARKALKQKLKRIMLERPDLTLVMKPEAHGVDVTATIKSLGIQLKWPPKKLAYQVVLLGTGLKKKEGFGI